MVKEFTIIIRKINKSITERGNFTFEEFSLKEWTERVTMYVSGVLGHLGDSICPYYSLTREKEVLGQC